MTKFIGEPKEIIKKYRNTEPNLLVVLRGICLTILLAILFVYFVISIIFIATDKPFLTKVLVPQKYILVPVINISSKYEFSMTCGFNYLDKEQDPNNAFNDENCNKYISQTVCKEQDPNDAFNGRCVGLFNPPIQDKFNFSLPEKRYGITFLISMTNTYNATDDTGMQVRAYDQLFVPSQLPDSSRKLISHLPYFSDRLENLNFHVMSYRQVNNMYISRKIKNIQIPTFLTLLGIPTKYFPLPFIESSYESIRIPSKVLSFVKNTNPITYGSLFVGTRDWTEEIQYEHRSSNVPDSLALLSAFYGLLVGIYVCLFGWSGILPWGICQITCCKRRSKSNLREKFPRGIPIIVPLLLHQPKLDRLETLEKFIKLFLVNVEDQANPKPKPEGDEDEEDEILERKKKDRLSYRPLSFLSILNSAPMSRPSSRPQTRPVSKASKSTKSTEENEVIPGIPDIPFIPELEEELTTANVPPSNENANKRPLSEHFSFFLPNSSKSGSSDKGKSIQPPNHILSATNNIPSELQPDASSTNNSPNPNIGGVSDSTSHATNNLPTKSQTGVPSTMNTKASPSATNNLPKTDEPNTGGASDSTPYTTNNLPTKSQTGVPSMTNTKASPIETKNLPTGSQTDKPSAIQNINGASDSTPYTTNNLSTKSQTGIPSTTTSPFSIKDLPTGSQTDEPLAIQNIGGASDSTPYATNNLPIKSQTGVPSTTNTKASPSGSSQTDASVIPTNNLPTDGALDNTPYTKVSDIPFSTNNLLTESAIGIPSTTSNIETKDKASDKVEKTQIFENDNQLFPEVEKRKSTIYVDEDGNPLSPEEAENIRKSVVYVDEQGNSLSSEESEAHVDEQSDSLSSEEAENVRRSVIYVDEQGNLLSSEEAENIRKSVVYVDEQGNSLSSEEAENIRNSVAYVDEQDNSLSPEEIENIRKSIIDEQGDSLSSEEAENVRRSVIYVDEQGNLLSPEEAENIRTSVIYVDEQGNSLPPEEAERIRNSVIYEVDLGEGPSKDSITQEDKNEESIDIPTSKTSNSPLLVSRLKRLFRKNKK